MFLVEILMMMRFCLLGVWIENSRHFGVDDVHWLVLVG